MTLLMPSAATGKDVLFSLQAITSLLVVRCCSAKKAVVKGRFQHASHGQWRHHSQPQSTSLGRPEGTKSRGDVTKGQMTWPR